MSYQKIKLDKRFHIEVGLEGHRGADDLPLTPAVKTRFLSRLIDAVLQELAQLESQLSKSNEDVVIQSHIVFTKGNYAKIL